MVPLVPCCVCSEFENGTGLITRIYNFVVAACGGDDGPCRARHVPLTWRPAAPHSLRWQLSQHSPGVVCARRKAACRAAYRAARRCLPCHTPLRRLVSAASADNIQSIYQGAWVPRLAHSRGPHSYQLTVAQSAAIRHKEAAGERRSIYCVGAADRRRDCGGGVLAVRQLLVSGAGGSAGGRLTSDGGRVHARVAPAVRGAEPRRPGFIVASAAKCAAVRARLTLRSATSLPAILSPPPL